MIDLVSHEATCQLDVITAFNRMKSVARMRQLEQQFIGYYLDRYKSAIDQIYEASKNSSIQQVIDDVKEHRSTLSQKARELCYALKPLELRKLIVARNKQKQARSNFFKSSYKSNKHKSSKRK